MLKKYEKTDRPLVELKGVRGGLGLFLDTKASFEAILLEVKRLLSQPGFKEFIRSAPIALQADNAALPADQFNLLQTLFQDLGQVTLRVETPPIKAATRKTETANSETNNAPESTPSQPIATVLAESTPPLESPAPPLGESIKESSFQDSSIQSEKSSAGLVLDNFALEDAEAVKMIRHTLRSGQKVNSPHSVIVIGDINPGAEIHSCKDIVVMGVIRGLVHAGCQGDVKAVVLGTQLKDAQIRIADEVSQPSKRTKPMNSTPGNWNEPEIAFLNKGEIVIEPYRKK